MRFIFVKELIKKAKKNKNIYLLTSDLGYRAFEDFKRLFPNRFILIITVFVIVRYGFWKLTGTKKWSCLFKFILFNWNNLCELFVISAF